MKRKIGLAGVALVIAVSAAGLALAAPGDSDNDDGMDIDVVLQVRVAAFFSGYGLESGDPIADTRIEVFAEGDATAIALFEGVTDQEGRLALPIESGRYRITAEAGTADPMCWWYGEAGDLELGRDTEDLITIEAGLMCE